MLWASVVHRKQNEAQKSRTEGSLRFEAEDFYDIWGIDLANPED